MPPAEQGAVSALIERQAGGVLASRMIKQMLAGVPTPAGSILAPATAEADTVGRQLQAARPPSADHAAESDRIHRSPFTTVGAAGAGPPQMGAVKLGGRQRRSV